MSPKKLNWMANLMSFSAGYMRLDYVKPTDYDLTELH